MADLTITATISEEREIIATEFSHETMVVATVTPQGQTVIASATIGGPEGPRGKGIPSGGDEGEFLIKKSDEDFDYEWETVTPTGDKHYEQAFSFADEIMVTHNLQKFPAVTVIDSANDEVVGEVEYLNMNSLLVKFTGAFSGKVYCN